MKPASEIHKFVLMEEERFNNIMTCIRGYDVTSRYGDNIDNHWIQRQKVLRNLNQLEKDIFRNSISILFDSRNGSMVVDDEMLGTNAKGYDGKAFSDRKAGKNGPIADAMADSMVCMLLGLRMRIPGESQKQNVQALLSTVPITTNRGKRARFSTDRGYTTEEMLAHKSLDAFDVTAINNSAARNPFFP